MPSYLIHILSENHNGLIGDVEPVQVNGRAEREAAKKMLKRTVWSKARQRKKGQVTVGAGKGYALENSSKMSRSSAQARFTFAAYNLTRLATLCGWREQPA